MQGDAAYPLNYTDGTWTSLSAGGSSVSVGTAVRQYNSSSDDPGTFDTVASRWWYAGMFVVRPAASGGAVVFLRRMFTVS